MYQPAYIHPLGLDGVHRPAAAPEMRCKTDSRDVVVVAARGRILLCTRWVGRWVWVLPNNVCCWSFRGGVRRGWPRVKEGYSSSQMVLFKNYISNDYKHFLFEVIYGRKIFELSLQTFHSPLWGCGSWAIPVVVRNGCGGMVAGWLTGTCII